jgi:hypothetical protein
VIVTSPKSVPLATAGQFRDAALARFAPRVREIAPSADVAVCVDVSRPGEPGFLVELTSDLTTVRSDGTAHQDAEVAAWVRSLVPAPSVRLIGFDPSWTWHVELVPGASAEQVLGGRVDHSAPGWADGDPDLR